MNRRHYFQNSTLALSNSVIAFLLSMEAWMEMNRRHNFLNNTLALSNGVAVFPVSMEA